VASDGHLCYLCIIHMFWELPAIGLVAVKLIEEVLRPFININVMRECIKSVFFFLEYQ